MKVRRGMIVGLLAAAALSGCAAGGVGAGPLTSPTGKVYEPGTPPTQTAQSRAATLQNATGQFETALAEAREGIAADSTNPIHYYLAGEAAAGLQDYALADSMWRVAERIYPAYEMEIEPARDQAWADAFNAGVEAYQMNDAETALRMWRGAHLIYKLRPEAARNLAILLQQEGEFDEAIEVYQEALENLALVPATREITPEEQAERDEMAAEMRASLAQLLLFTEQYAAAEALFRQQLAADPGNVEIQANLATALAQQGNTAEASRIYNELLGAPNLTATQLFNVGVALFNAGEYGRAAEAFERVTDLQPRSRDAWYNLSNALYAGELWAELAEVAPQVADADPLNENAALIVARAYRETDQNDLALEALRRIEQLPVFIEEATLRPAGESTSVTGRVVGNAAPQGSPVRIEFTFYNDSATVGTSTLTVNAPAAEQSTEFEVEVQAEANAYSYRHLP